MSAVEYQNQNVEHNEFQNSPIDDNNILFLPSSQLTESPMDDPLYFEGGDFINQDFCYYYYNNQLTPEEQAMLYNNNNELCINDQVITWTSELELQSHMSEFPYLYNDFIENGNFDSYNPFIGQSSVYDDSNSTPTLGGNLLLTQPLSEVTQNVIENQQFYPYNWCDLSSDTQQQFTTTNDGEIISKIAEQNHQNHQSSNHNISNISNISSENYYTPWTDFQLLEA